MSSRLSATQQTNGLAAALATGRSAALALRNCSICSMPHSAHPPTAASFSVTAVGSCWASASASASVASRLYQQAPARHGAALRSALRVMPRLWALGSSSATPSASTPAAVRCFSSRLAAALPHASTRKPVGAAAAAAAASSGAHIRSVMRPGTPLHSRQLMAAAKPGRTGASGAVAGPSVGVGKRAVLHPTAILAARSSRHFSSLEHRYDASHVGVMLRRSMDPKVVLYALMGARTVLVPYSCVTLAFSPET